ncbi:MAG TPA: ABC transporter ATP-binding protein [Aestuariivirgaceae bacterium]|nr:ABC transporter ATP-binding protein [Aestuariivirgaceae bacterium]
MTVECNSSATLEISNLSIEFPGRTGPRRVVERMSLTVAPGEIVAIIGESGSGKTLTALSVLGLLPRQARIRSGSILLKGHPLIGLTAQERRSILGNRIAFIPQDALRALNPTLIVADQVGEPFVLHRGTAWAAARCLAVELLRSVHLRDPEQRAKEYPHQYSGGMQQRAMVAMGLALEPELLIADEPTTALDVTVQAQVLALLREVREEHGTAILFITHDLGLVADFCDRVYVMYAGRVVEEGPVEEIFVRPRHPYTYALLSATPSVGERTPELLAIPGQIPQPHELPEGCAFAPRCVRAEARCSVDPLFDTGGAHRTRCWFPERRS